MASRADRAKIFLPFNPLRGFQEALEAQERVRIPRPELSDDAAEALDRALRHLRPGDTASVLYYADEACHRLSGQVLRVDARLRQLAIGGAAIPFEALLEVEEAGEALEPETAGGGTPTG